LDTIKLLDQAPASVHEHAHEMHKQQIAAKAVASLKHTDADDSHSLQGKHGKTHGIC
jgi:hypothetical protein